MKSKTLIAILGLACGFATHANAADVVLKYAHIFNPEHAIHKGALELARIVKEKTNGRIEVRVLPSEQLGSERQVMEGLQFGSVEMGYVTGNVVDSFEPAAGLLSLPYIVRDFEHGFSIEDGPIGDEIKRRVLEKTSVRILGHNVTGFRMLATKARRVQSLKNFAGLKVRVPESPVMVDTFRALGANPTPLPWGELYTALQTNLVDAGEAPPAALADIKVFEVAKLLTQTNHVYTNGYIMINDRVWQRLSAEDRAILAEAALANQALQRRLTVEAQSSILEKLKADGVEVISIDTGPLQAAVAPIYEKFAKSLEGGAELIAKIQKSK